jgi:orotidine-5'-phosphate decarboxylase
MQLKKDSMEMQENNAAKIIIALDVGSREEGVSLVMQLKETRIFKIGLQLFTALGPSMITELQDLGKKVFLDLKLHDIPNTVAEAVRMGVRYGVSMMTLHASGGKEMMSSAVQSGREEADKVGMEPPLLLAVTVLTSLKNENLKEIGIPSGTMDQVQNLAALAQQAGISGIVCSPQEIKTIKKKFGSGLTIVAPGIRPQWAALQDQKRILTPQQAVQMGADFLVIGRPITKAPSPRDAFLRIVDELDGSIKPAHSAD